MSRCTFLTVIHRHFIISFIPRVIPLSPSLSCLACFEVFCVPFPPGGCWGRTPVVAMLRLRMSMQISQECTRRRAVRAVLARRGRVHWSSAVCLRGENTPVVEVRMCLEGFWEEAAPFPRSQLSLVLSPPVCAVDAPLSITPPPLSVVCHGFAEACYFVPTVRRRPRRPDRWALEPLAS